MWRELWGALSLPFCPLLGGEPEPWLPLDRLCEDCLEELGRLGFAPQELGKGHGRIELRAVFAYRGSGGRLVRRAKFERDRAALGYLGRALAARAGGLPRARLMIAPVPLAKERRKERGFNQAAELARFVGRKLHAPVLEHALRRGRETVPQGQAGPGARQRNVKGAFVAGRSAWRVRGERVLLIDDVVTSGATLSECARVLRACGARDVAALCAASALPVREGFADSLHSPVIHA